MIPDLSFGGFSWVVFSIGSLSLGVGMMGDPMSRGGDLGQIGSLLISVPTLKSFT